MSNTALQLIFSYLSNRSQAVLHNNNNPSSYLNFTASVLQGSSPAGLLFNVHIKPLSTALNKFKNSHLLFVNDFQIWLKCKPSEIDLTIKHLNSENINIHEWFLKHRLKPNPAKTQAIIMGTATNVKLAHSLNHIPLVINYIQISYTLNPT